MKKLINVAIVLGLIVYAGEYLKKNNTDLYEVFDVKTGKVLVELLPKELRAEFEDDAV